MDKFELDKRSMWRLSVLAGLVVLFGTIGLSVSGHLSWPNALYETMVILLTHFYHTDFTDPISRGIVLALIISSVVFFAYLLKLGADYMMGLQGNMRRLRVKAKVERLKNHYIVCGLGRVGAQVARELYSEKVPFVALDRDPAKIEEAIKNGYLAMTLDSTDESSLQQANIKEASGLVASLGDDSQNLLVALSARSENPNLYIVARVNRAENELKLRRAGADRVAMPYQIGGYHMASMVLRPNVVDYMDVVPMQKNNAGMAVEEMIVGAKSPLAGQRLGKILNNQVKATVIAINGVDGASHVRPTGREMIYAGDRLIIMGSKPDLTKASELIR
jgi:voltage-gated potassium channel